MYNIITDSESISFDKNINGLDVSIQVDVNKYLRNLDINKSNTEDK